MPSTTTDLEICNLALSAIGKKNIASLTDTTSEEAIQCNRVFSSLKETVLRDHDWRFATVIKPLVESDTFQAIGWLFTYVYPTGCEFVRRVFVDTENSNPDPVNFELVQDDVTGNLYIATDYEGCHVKYTRGPAAPNTTYDPLFVESLKYKLAATIAYPLTRNLDVAKAMMAMYAAADDKAKLLDRQEDKRTIPTSQVSSYEKER